MDNSGVLTCRNPFKADETLINYDLDTEDELAEENGEDLNVDGDNNLSDDNESDLEEKELQIGFIVDDDYLSDEEMNYSNISNKDQQQIHEDKERRKQIL